MKSNFVRALVLVGVGLILGLSVAGAVTMAKKKVYEGVISQINNADGSFIIRMRDGSLVTVKSPLESGLFVQVKGVWDTLTNLISGVSQITIMDTSSIVPIPSIASISPGSGTVGTKITLTGNGFTKKKNSITIGDVKNAVINLTSQGQALTFSFPSAPCNQVLKINCPTTVLPAGIYNLIVVNENGVSNSVPFQITQLPNLNIVTDILPQTYANAKYKVMIDAIGGAERYDWRVSDGKLPPGTILAQGICTDLPCKSSAVISGTPALPGVYQFIVTLASGSETISRQFSITVVQPLGSGINYGY